MDRADIVEHLELARRHIAQGERLIARQVEIVAEMERNGHDSSRARQLLVSFQDAQMLHVADRDRLEKKLADFSK